MVPREHALSDLGVRVRNYKCFGEEPQGWTEFSPINVVIGRNNSGKSTLIDLIGLATGQGDPFDATKHSRGSENFHLEVSETVSEATLQQVFRSDTSGGDIGMNHWAYGERFLGSRLVRIVDKNDNLVETRLLDDNGQPTNVRTNYLPHIGQRNEWGFKGKTFLRISAERDIRPEGRTASVSLAPNGQGVTNAIRAFINSDRLPTNAVTEGILADLNVIYRGDSLFRAISCQESDNEIWEIFLHESEKSNIRLSQSGSGLKTAFIIACYLRLLKHITSFSWSSTVLCIEEPENNLHPALLRRLLEYLASYQLEFGFALVVTTHSSACIDWAAKREDGQIVHVRHEAGVSTASPSLGYHSNVDILDDLDVRASDLLQANGIIWVEGPSDRIYINRWIELASGGKIREGLHYTVMFYAGKLLSHLDVLAPSEARTLVSLVSINRNVALLMDSDRHLGTTKSKKPRMNLNATKRRVRDEVDEAGGFIWITEGREIENYISIRSLTALAGDTLKRCGQYDKIPESPSLSRFQNNKITLAHEYAKAAKLDDLDVLDLRSQVEDLCNRIRKWNR